MADDHDAPGTEQELRRRVADLERHLRDLTAESEEKNRLLEQFALFMAHDLREPLRTLKNYPKLLAKRHADKVDLASDDFMRRIAAAADTMESLIDNLTKYIRVVFSGRASLVPVACGKVLAAAITNLQPGIQDSGADVTSDPLPTVTGHEGQLTLLFQNLVGNAVKFRAGDRPPAVHVTAEGRPGEWLFSVRDNGLGIEEQYLKKIFELGARLHGKRLYPGTGIGLAVCERVVEGHGGRIWAESKLGQGSEFFFTLPAGVVPG